MLLVDSFSDYLAQFNDEIYNFIHSTKNSFGRILSFFLICISDLSNELKSNHKFFADDNSLLFRSQFRCVSETPTQVFSCEFCGIFKNTFFYGDCFYFEMFRNI